MLMQASCSRRSWVTTSAPTHFIGQQPCSVHLNRRSSLCSRQLPITPCTLGTPGPSSSSSGGHGELLPSSDEQEGANNLSSAIHYSLSEVAKLQGR